MLSTDPHLSNLLRQFMESAGYHGASRLADRVNEIFETPGFIHRGTIANWLDGHVKAVRDWRKLIAVAVVLGLDTTQVNTLLQAAQLPTLWELWLEIDETDHHFLKQMPSTYFPGFPDANQIPLPGPLTPGSRMPLRSSSLFVGRESELAMLACALQNGSMVAVGQTVTVTGLGGIGKTQLAVEFAHRYGRYFPGGVFWFNFDQPQDIPAQIAASGGPGALDLYSGFNRLRLAEQVQIVQKEWQKPIPRLLIFDECEEESALTKWRPSHGGCSVIVTSKRGEWSPGLGITSLRLDTFRREESVALLHHLQPKLTSLEADKIAVELGDLPLALHLAGSFLNAFFYDVSSADYLNQLQALHGGKLLTHPSLQGWGTEYSPTNHASHVRRTFVCSYERLDPSCQSDALARILLARAACFAPNELVPRNLLFAAVSGEKDELLLATALKRLVTLGLISQGEAGMIRLHQLITEFIKGMNTDPTAQLDVEKTLLLEAKHLNTRGDLVSLRALQSHLYHVTSTAQPRKDAQAAGLAHELGRYFWLNRDVAKARLYCENALAIREQVLGIEHPYVADSLNNLGILLQVVGDYTEAQLHYERALEIDRKILGSEHPDTARSLDNMGLFLLSAMGDYAGAWTYLEEAQKVFEKTLGAEHYYTARSLHSLGFLLRVMGDYVGAQSYSERALRIFRKELGPEYSYYISPVLNNMGLLLQAMGDYREAQAYYEQALAITEEAVGLEHPMMAWSLSNFGFLLYTLGEYERAWSYCEQEFAICEKAHGSMQLGKARSLYNLGLLWQTTGNYEEARTCLEQALTIREEVLAPSHSTIAQSLTSLGHFCRTIGNGADAQVYYKRALTIQEKALGTDHPETAETYHGLGVLFRITGDLDNSRTYLERALVIREQKLCRSHLDTAATLNDLGVLHQSIGDVSSAITYFKRSHHVFNVILGADHDKTQAVQRNLQDLQGAM